MQALKRKDVPETVFITETNLSLPPGAPEIFRSGKSWKVVDSEGIKHSLLPPEREGKKDYGVTVDDVYLMYDSVDNALVWSISWSPT